MNNDPEGVIVTPSCRFVHSHPHAATPEVHGIHVLRTRASGPQIFIQCHIEMDGKLSLWAAHDVADRIEMQLEEAFPGAEVILHEDPYLGESRPGHITENEATG